MKTLKTFLAASLVFHFLLMGLLLSGGSSVHAETDQVLATIGEDRITRQDLENRLHSYPPSFREQFETREGREHLLKELLRIEVFSREGEALGLHRGEAFQAKQKAITGALLAEEYARQKILADIALDEQEIRDYYTQHPDLFTIPERIRAPSIFVAIPADATPEKIAEKMTKASSAASRLESGEDFQAVAETLSERTSREDPEHFSRGRLVPEIEEQVFALKVREVSPVLRVAEGLLVFRMEDRLPAEVAPYQTVREEVLKQLRTEHRRSRFEEAERRLFQKYRVTLAGVAAPQSNEGDAHGGQSSALVGNIIRIMAAERKGAEVGEGMTIVVQESGDRANVYGQAAVTLTKETPVFLRKGKELEPVGAAWLKVGQPVEILLTGPIAPSFPVQAKAGRVVITQNAP